MKRTVICAAVAAIVASALIPASADPGVQPGFLEGICVGRIPPDPDCGAIAYPGDVWSVAAILPVRAGGEAAYDALIPAPFYPIEGKREIAVLMFRLNVVPSPTSSIDTDPGDGYAEGSVAIRVGFPAHEGFPYREGWWDLAQPLNDQSQYDAGRGIGLPKYIAEAGLRRDGDGIWSGRALDWAKTADQAAPGIARVAGGNVLRISWSPIEPVTTPEHRAKLRAWGQYGEPLFVQTRPFDENAAHDPAMVKFTPVAVLPLADVPRTPVTEYPDPVIGTARVTLEGSISGAHTNVSAGSFADILEPGEHVVAGTVAFGRGLAWVTSDDLRNNQS